MADYQTMPLFEQNQLLGLEARNVHRLTAKAQMWRQAATEIGAAAKDLGKETARIEPKWTDAAGQAFVERTRNTKRVMDTWQHNIESARPDAVLTQLAELIPRALLLAHQQKTKCFNEWLQNFSKYMAEGYVSWVHFETHPAFNWRRPSGLLMNQIADLYGRATTAVTRASAGGRYVGPNTPTAPRPRGGVGGGGVGGGGVGGGGVGGGGVGGGGGAGAGVAGLAAGVGGGAGGGVLQPSGASVPEPRLRAMEITATVDPTNPALAGGPGQNPTLSGGPGNLTPTAPTLPGSLPGGTSGGGGVLNPVVVPPLVPGRGIGPGGTLLPAGTAGGGSGARLPGLTLPGGAPGGGPGGTGPGGLTPGGASGGTGPVGWAPGGGLPGGAPGGGAPGVSGPGVGMPGVTHPGGGAPGVGVPGGGGIGGGVGNPMIPAAAPPVPAAGPTPVAAAPPPAPTLSAVPGGAAGAAAGTPPMVPPMMPPMGMGGGGGAAPGSGATSRPGGTGRRERRGYDATPGLPTALSGRAGRADAHAFAVRPRRAAAESDLPTTIEVVDEDLWQVAEDPAVEQPAPTRRTPRAGL